MDIGIVSGAYPDRVPAPGGAASLRVGKATPPQPASPGSPGLAPESIDLLLAHMNGTMRSIDAELVFTRDPDSRRTVVRLVDTATEEILFQFPTEQALEVARALGRLKGALVDEAA